MKTNDEFIKKYGEVCINGLVAVTRLLSSVQLRLCFVFIICSKSGESCGKISTLAEKLIGNLADIAQWKDLPGKAVARDTAIKNFISRSVECDSSLDEIKEQLRKVHVEKLLISKEVFTKGLQFADDEYIKSKPSHVLHAQEEQLGSATKDNQVEPLFCKDSVYHASLCCCAVSTYDAGNYQKFFKNKELVPGHSFNAVSFSRSKEENFLIAQKGESTFYFAFQGKLSLSDWAKEYSFNEGRLGSISSLLVLGSCTLLFMI